MGWGVYDSDHSDHAARLVQRTALPEGYFAAQGIETIALAHAEADMKAGSEEHMAGSKMLKKRRESNVPSRRTRFIKDNFNTRPMVNVGLPLKSFNINLTLYNRTLLLCMFAVAV